MQICSTLLALAIFSYTDCINGDVVLMNGSMPSVGEGRVEICYDNIYRTICDDNWDENDASVVCRQLNFTGNGNIKECIL